MTNNADVEWPYPGARWWKFDFHTHTPASVDYGKGPNQADLKKVAPREWLLGFMRAGVDCVAVTDHNSGDWIDELKNALHELGREPPPDFRALHLFPGVEITANGGIHILAVLDGDKGAAEVSALLGAVKYQGVRGASDAAANLAAIEVVKAISDAGGIPILAHVDGPSGAWGLTGNTLAPLLDLDDLFAMEVVDVAREKPEMYKQRKLAWSEVLGSDSHHPTGESGDRYPGSHYTWVKMETPSLEGLRLALLDGGRFSIRRSDDASELFDPFRLPEHFIESIEIADARYMGRGRPAKFEFNPWLNALIGGRGTGKSTVIHLLRLAARRKEELGRPHPKEASEPLSTFEQFNRVPSAQLESGGLTDSTKIYWNVMRDGARYRIHWTQDGSGLAVEEAFDDDWKPSNVQTVTPERFPVRIFSQGQIAGLAGKNQQTLLKVVDEAAGIAVFQRHLTEIQNAFLASRAQIRKLDAQLVRRNELLVKQQDVERKLKRFEEAGHAAILTSYRQRGVQRKEVDRQINVAEEGVGRIDATAETLQAEDLPEGVFDKESEEDKQIVAAMDALAAAVHSAAKGLRDCAQRLREAIEAQRGALTRSGWQKAFEQASSDYRQLVETLRAAGVSDPNAYGHLVQERQRIDTEMNLLDSMREKRARLEDQSGNQLRQILEARRAVSAHREKYLKDTLAHNKFVRIEIRTYGEDAQVVERSLREALEVMDDRFQRDILVTEDEKPTEGMVAELFRGLPTEDPSARCTEIERRLDDLKSRFIAASSGAGNFGGYFNNYLSRELGRKPEMLDRLLAWFPGDGLNVEYSRDGDGRNFLPIGHASAGQRSAAILAFLLARGEEPLVLDQPEDDLDNRLIYDLIVRQIRENKLRRQIIVVTHNPNIVVNGDAEMLHALDFKAGQCVVAQSGSLQKEDMREEVCRVMEGGREAFERRYRRLGPEPTHV